MNLFVKRLFVFSIPFLIYLIIACWIDPYNIIHAEKNKKIAELESKVPYELNRPLYELQIYKNHPTDVILLGDSRTELLKSSLFGELLNMETTNMAYGGGTIPEIVDTFWYISKSHALKQVYIGLSFNLFNEHDDFNRVPEATGLIDSPVSYLFSQYCSKSVYLIIKSLISQKDADLGIAKVNKEELWQLLLGRVSKSYAYYKFPVSFEKSLTEISEYCKEKGIKLVFFIPPSHTDLQQKVKEFGLEEEEKQFRAFLSTLGNTHDFCVPNEMTRNYKNFSDPFHYVDSISSIIVREIVIK
jgi:hypothetical protein